MDIHTNQKIYWEIYFIYISGIFQSYEQYFIIFGYNWDKKDIIQVHNMCIINQYLTNTLNKKMKHNPYIPTF